MQYQVSRNGQLYGPYTLEDLQRYVASGHILYTDLAKSEDMPEWLPVSQILGASRRPMPRLLATSLRRPQGFPIPPRPIFIGVSFFSSAILTCGLFSVAWDFVQVLWMKKVQPDTKAMMYFIIFAILWLSNLGSSAGRIWRSLCTEEWHTLLHWRVLSRWRRWSF